jgi:hypothetical protein
MAECQTVGEPCTGYHECCTGLCADPGTGVPICQFISGCRPIGEICIQANDCCSGVCEVYEDTGILRCQKTGSCMDTGEICNVGQAANCCPTGPLGGPRLCLPTVLGLTRCYDPDAVDDCLPDGSPCSFGDECCGGFCLPDQNGDLFCGAVCVPEGEACTVDMDCCEGVCTDGLCAPNFTDCQPIGGACEAPEDCCSNYCDLTAGLCLPPVS